MAGGGRTHSVFLGGPGVRYEERPPHPALAPWVAVHWRIEADVDFELRIPPDGCMDVIGADAIGSFTTFGVARLPAGSVSSGIRFHPGGFPALFGRIPGREPHPVALGKELVVCLLDFGDRCILVDLQDR